MESKLRANSSKFCLRLSSAWPNAIRPTTGGGGIGTLAGCGGASMLRDAPNSTELRRKRENNAGRSVALDADTASSGAGVPAIARMEDVVRRTAFHVVCWSCGRYPAEYTALSTDKGVIPPYLNS